MKKHILLACLLLISTSIFAQINKFEKEIKAYESQDSLSMPAKNLRLFFGSSSFRLWKTFDRDMAAYPSINRGFGGSTLEEALYYFDRMVLKYQPAWVFMYEGDNDLAKGQSPEFIAQEFVDFSRRLREKLPNTKLVFIAARPSLARIAMLDKQKDLNARIQQIVSKEKGRFYVDMQSPFFRADGSLMDDVFVEDRLHLNEKGYQLFVKQIHEFIQKHP
ncbi:GDSL-type esterase/lipase family protein [Aquirufa aurantiipilula]